MSTSMWCRQTLTDRKQDCAQTFVAGFVAVVVAGALEMVHVDQREHEPPSTALGRRSRAGHRTLSYRLHQRLITATTSPVVPLQIQPLDPIAKLVFAVD